MLLRKQRIHSVSYYTRGSYYVSSVFGCGGRIEREGPKNHIHVMPSTRTHYFFVQTPIRVRVLLFIKKEAIAFATNREHINLKSGGWLKRKTFKCEALKKPKIRQRGSFYLKKLGCFAKIQSRGTRAHFRHSITRRHQL